MCVHNDNKRAELQKQIDDLKLEISNYDKLRTDVVAGKAQVDCYLENLKAFKEACSQVSAAGSYDNGESETYIKEFNSMGKELDNQKIAADKAIQGMWDSIRWIGMTMQYLDSDCAACKAAAAAAAASTYSSKSKSNT